MTSVNGAGPGGGSGHDEPDDSATLVLRGVLVVALVAAAGLTLQARQGLDWDRLADPLQVRWARVLIGTVALLILAATGRRLLRRLRRPKLRPGGGDRAEPEGEPFPFLLRVLAVAVVLAALALAWFVVNGLTGLPRDLPGLQVAPPPDGSQLEGATPEDTHWPTLLVVAALLLSVAVAARIRAVRRAGAPGQAIDGTEDAPEAAELSSAVAAAEAQLAGPGDARAAIVAAYTAMAARIASGLARRGRSASAADTPTELLERAASAGLVDGTAAGTLTRLFREARFSRHPMGEAHRRAAERALAQVRDELAARRA